MTEPTEVTVTGCPCGTCDRAICEIAGIDGLKRALGGTSSEWHACLALGTKWYTWDHWREWNAVQLSGATFRGPSHWVPPEPRQPSGPAIDRASAVESVDRHATVAGSCSAELQLRDLLKAAERAASILHDFANWRAKANEYDTDVGHEPRIYCEDIELIEKAAQSALDDLREELDRWTK